MASRGQSVTVSYVAWDTSANAGKTGDVLNHTLRVVKDGTSAAPTNSPSEVDATNAPGVYKLTLTATECTADCVTVCGKSSTANISIMPITILFEQLPTAAPTSAGGVRDAAFINGVATSSVTAVNANVGTTTAIAFGADNLPKVGIWGFLGTLFTESVGGNIAGAFKKAFDVASSVWTTASVNQTGDSFARIGANGGALTAIAQASTALSNVNWTNALAGLLNTLAGHDPGGTLASAASQASIITDVLALGSPMQAGNVTVGGYASGQDPATLVLAASIETGVSMKQALQRIGATTAGKLSGSLTNTEVFVGLDGATTRVTVTTDTSGNRTAITYV